MHGGVGPCPVPLSVCRGGRVSCLSRAGSVARLCRRRRVRRGVCVQWGTAGEGGAGRCAYGHRGLPALLGSKAHAAGTQGPWPETLVGSLLAAGKFFEVRSAVCDVLGA